jgi:hypothetical protein
MPGHDDLKKALKEKHIDRRILAEKIKVTPAYLSLMLNGWAPMKDSYLQIIRQEINQNTTQNTA